MTTPKTRRFRIADSARANTASNPVLPSAVLIREDGSAIAEYDDMPLLRFATLEDLLRRYELDRRDLAERPPESSTRRRDGMESHGTRSRRSS